MRCGAPQHMSRVHRVPELSTDKRVGHARCPSRSGVVQHRRSRARTEPPCGVMEKHSHCAWFTVHGSWTVDCGLDCGLDCVDWTAVGCGLGCGLWRRKRELADCSADSGILACGWDIPSNSPTWRQEGRVHLRDMMERQTLPPTPTDNELPHRQSTDWTTYSTGTAHAG